MRRLTGLVAAIAITFGVTVFLFFPRGGGANIVSPWQLRNSTACSYTSPVSLRPQ